MDVERHGVFRLEEEFLRRFRSRPVPWGFGALSWVTFKRTYSRDEGREAWWQTCRRVVEGMLTVQRAHCLERGLAWDDDAARGLGEEAYRRLFRFQWTPPGRGLWTMGTRFVYERGGTALNNCGFVSTADIGGDYADPFAWMLRMSMLGVGVGFDTRGRGALALQRPARGPDVHRIEDSREGWAEAVRRLLGAYAGRGTLPARWDLSEIRPAGARLESFGGHASGPGPLRDLLDSLEALHEEYVGRTVDSRLLVDAMNLIGRCVVAGGTRRSAQIAFGDPRDRVFLDLKQDRDAARDWRWVANHSVFAEIGMDYDDVARRTARNGEPGFLWLENARAYGRTGDPPTWADEGALGSNPCVEQTLWHKELCCLVETFPARHESYEDYARTLRFAYEYAKTVTLVATGDPSSDDVMARNRRMGCSMTGVVQAVNRHGRERFFRWCDRGYRLVQELDRRRSQALRVPRSIKTTSIKPSGTVSILAGATPGVHWEHAPTYLRRIRIGEGHPLVAMCREAGYPVEPDRHAPRTTVIAFPVRIEHLPRRKADVPLREKLELAAQMQRLWSDNQVSCTAEFDPDKEGADISRLVQEYERRLKAIAFLPARGHGYAQPPYEEISPGAHEDLVSRLRPLRGHLPHEVDSEARFCEGGTCELP